MKKILLSMLLCLACLGVARAQETTLTVYQDATATSEYVPVHGMWADAYLKCEFIVPAEQLQDMANSNVSQMTFYLSSPAEQAWTGTFQVFLKEVYNTTISEYTGVANATIVYTGSLNGTASTMEVPFNTPFTYTDGNLLVGVYQTTKGNYKSANFTGASVTGASVQGYSSSSLDAISPNQRNFIPKTTFTYTPISGVVCTKPTLTVSDISTSGATLTWAGGSGTYNVSLRQAPNGSWNDIMLGTTATTFTLSGLNPLTSYEARVQSVCEDDVTSDWRTASFTTTAAPQEVGEIWLDDFDNDACGWELINGTCTNAWTWGTATGGSAGPYALYISNDGGTSHAYTVNATSMVYATKLLHFTEGRFRFYHQWLCNGEGSYDFLRVALVPATETFTAGTTKPTGFNYNTLPDGWIALDGGNKLSGAATEWQDNITDIDLVEGYYYMVFAWYNDQSVGNQPPAVVDNVQITKITCLHVVEDLAVSDITLTSAKLSWTAGEATQWQVALKEGDGNWGFYGNTLNTNTVTLTSLTPATNYQVMVRAVCDEANWDVGIWTDILTFSTDCETFTDYPYTENFDSYTTSTDVLPVCWRRINTTTNNTYKGYPKIYKYENNNRLYFYSSSSNDPKDQYAILPEMEDLAGKQITIQAMGNGDDYSTLKIGTMTDPADASTFTVISTKTLTSYFQQYTCIVPDNETADHVAFLMEAANSDNPNRFVFVDDITITACPTPSNASSPLQTATTALLLWYGSANVESYTVRYRVPEHTEGGLLETFGTSIPIGWENKKNLLSNVMEGSGLANASQWEFGSSNGVFDDHARINIWGRSIYGWLITPVFTLGSADFTFDLALTAYNGTGAATGACTDDRFVVLVSTDDEETWTILREWNNSGSTDVYNNIPTAGTNVSIDLSAYVGRRVRIAFYGESTATGGDNNLHIDNVLIGNPIVVPTSEWTTITIDTANINLTGLTPGTTYEAQVKSDCSDPEEWSNTVTFTTREQSAFTQTVELTEGWNWFSTYIADEPTDLLQALKISLGANAEMIWSDGDGSTDYYPEDDEWEGTLDPNGLKNNQMYMIKTTAACTVELTGMPVDPATVEIIINPGWNWIGFPCTEEMSVANAFANFQSADEDMLWSNNDGTTDYYADDNEWDGTLVTLKPGQGYMYYSNSNQEKTLIFRTGLKAKK